MASAPKKTNLVWNNLIHYKVRTLVGIAGITFAVILIFMQLGFLGAAAASATLVYQQMDFDLLMLSTEYVEFSDARAFALRRLTRTLAEPGVIDTTPVYILSQFWRNKSGPEGILDKRRILVIAFPPDKRVFRLPAVIAAQYQLMIPETVLFDRYSHPIFAVPDEPVEALKSRTYWIGEQPVHIVGTFSLGAGFIADGMVLTSDSTYANQIGLPNTLDAVSMGLIKLAPEADPQAVAAGLNDLLGPGVRVWTRDDIEARERQYWIESTSVGIIFRCGLVVAVLVGIVFVYQVISSDIGSRLREFATLKAMGYGDGYLSLTVVHQAVLLAVFGYVPGLLISFGLYALTAKFAGLPIGFHGEAPFVVLSRCGTVLLITVGLCSISGIFALVKLKAADPADLF
jgi:putative ABC transport system permease protein